MLFGRARSNRELIIFLKLNGYFQGEIDAREDSFNQTADAGQKLLDERVGEGEDVKGKLEQLAKEKVGELAKETVAAGGNRTHDLRII